MFRHYRITWPSGLRFCFRTEDLGFKSSKLCFRFDLADLFQFLSSNNKWYHFIWNTNESISKIWNLHIQNPERMTADKVLIKILIFNTMFLFRTILYRMDFFSFSIIVRILLTYLPLCFIIVNKRTIRMKCCHEMSE